jgi:hypothetical protein
MNTVPEVVLALGLAFQKFGLAFKRSSRLYPSIQNVMAYSRNHTVRPSTSASAPSQRC